MKTLNPTEEEFAKIKRDIKARAVPVNLLGRSEGSRSTDKLIKTARNVQLRELGREIMADDLEAARSRSKERHSDKTRRTVGMTLSERAVMLACMDILEAHPRVALWWRQNTGAVKVDGRYLKFSFKGASDLMGVMRGGKYLAVECKATGKHASDDQTAFLANVDRAGGHALVVDDPAYLERWLWWI